MAGPTSCTLAILNINFVVTKVGCMSAGDEETERLAPSAHTSRPDQVPPDGLDEVRRRALCRARQLSHGGQEQDPNWSRTWSAPAR
jgi:hypothetical protein